MSAAGADWLERSERESEESPTKAVAQLGLKPGMTVEAGGYVATFDGLRAATGPNYTEDQAHFTIRKGGVEVADVWSSKRLYTARRMPTTEAGIVTFAQATAFSTKASYRLSCT